MEVHYHYTFDSSRLYVWNPSLTEPKRLQMFRFGRTNPRRPYDVWTVKWTTRTTRATSIISTRLGIMKPKDGWSGVTIPVVLPHKGEDYGSRYPDPDLIGPFDNGPTERNRIGDSGRSSFLIVSYPLMVKSINLFSRRLQCEFTLQLLLYWNTTSRVGTVSLWNWGL